MGLGHQMNQEDQRVFQYWVLTVQGGTWTNLCGKETSRTKDKCGGTGRSTWCDWGLQHLWLMVLASERKGWALMDPRLYLYLFLLGSDRKTEGLPGRTSAAG